MRVTFDTNTLDPITQPDLAGALRAECTAIHEALRSGRLAGFFCETIVTIEEPSSDARIARALDLGLRILSAPRTGSARIARCKLRSSNADAATSKLYANLPDEAALLSRFETIANAIGARGLGFARKLKVERARTPAAPKKLARAIAEWADGDSVAAHYGYANDLFCTQDRAVKAGRDSIMHPAHRAWLRRAFGVEFVNIAELGMLLGSTTRD